MNLNVFTCRQFHTVYTTHLNNWPFLCLLTITTTTTTATNEEKEEGYSSNAQNALQWTVSKKEKKKKKRKEKKKTQCRRFCLSVSLCLCLSVCLSLSIIHRQAINVQEINQVNLFSSNKLRHSTPENRPTVQTNGQASIHSPAISCNSGSHFRTHCSECWRLNFNQCG